MKILIINAVSYCESLLVTPVLRVLKTELTPETHLITEEKSKNLFQQNPYIDKVYTFNRSLVKLRGIIKNSNYDLVIDLENSLKSKVLRFNTSKRIIAYRKERLKYWIYTKTKINLLSKKHIVDQYLDLLVPLGIKGDSLGVDFFLPEKDEVEKEWLPKSHQSGYAVVAIGATYNTQKLPTNRLIELCDRINKPIILVGETEDLPVSNEIEAFFKLGTLEEEEEIKGLNKKTVIFNACGKFNFNQSASIIKNASWIFTYDNLMMHIAAAFKKRIYTIWGSNTPLFGKYPYRTQFIVFENNKLHCRPCSVKGFTNCPKGHFQCMDDLTFDFYLPD